MAYPFSNPLQSIASSLSTDVARETDDELFLIHAPGIDREELLRRVRQNATKRSLLPHPAAVVGQARSQIDRQKLLETLSALKRSMRDYGLVDSHRNGLLGRLDLFVKRAIRRLFQRHILQQHRVHLKLTKFLGLVIDYLETEDRTLRLCLDRCEQRYEQQNSERSDNTAIREGHTVALKRPARLPVPISTQ